jgi:hypothetical protein
MMLKRHLCFIVSSVLLALTACGQATPSGGGATVQEGHTATAEQGVQPVLATSELVVGPNRLALGLLENNVPIPDAAQTKVHLRYYRLKGDQATLVAEEDAPFYGEGLGPRGTFVGHPTFDTPGSWGLEVRMTRPGKATQTARLNVRVDARGKAVAVGAEAPRSKTPTTQDAKELKTITSAAEPDPRLHRLSVDQAVTSGKPSVILFATPGFCQTAVCGPGVDVVQRLADKFGDKLNAVHVEVYSYPFEKLEPVATMREWGLESEPWLFLVDGSGRVVDRYEGGITFQELEPAVAKLVS